MKKDLQLHRPKFKLSYIPFSVFVILLLSLTACQPQSRANPDISSSETAKPLPSGSSQTQALESSQTVTLANISFNPKQITVPLGTTVVWMNTDNTVHTVTADDQTFDSGNLNADDNFQFTFDKAGTYAYHCEIHGGPNGVGMSGQIVVTEK